jgi:hypothetical protein
LREPVPATLNEYVPTFLAANWHAPSSKPSSRLWGLRY